jgi:MFS family permease
MAKTKTVDKASLRLTPFEKKACLFLSLGLAACYVAASINGTYSTLFLSELLSLGAAGDQASKIQAQMVVGFFMAGGTLLCAIVLPLLGRLSDHIIAPKKRRFPILLIAFLVYLIALPLVPLAFKGHSLWGLVALLWSISLANGVFTSFLTILMDDFIPAPKVGRFAGWCGLFGYSGNWIGYLIASFFSFSSFVLSKDFWTLQIPFLAGTLLLLLGGIFPLLLAYQNASYSPNTIVAPLAVAPQKAKINKPIALLLIALVFSTIGFGAFSSFASPYFQYYLVNDTANLSYASLISSLVATALFVPANLLAEKKGGRAIALLSFALGLVCFGWIYFLKPSGDQVVDASGAITSWASFNPQFFLCYALLGLALGLDNTVYPLYLRYLPKGKEATYTALYNGIANLTGCFVIVAGGLLLSGTGVWWVLPLIDVIGFTIAILCFCFLPKNPPEGLSLEGSGRTPETMGK